MLFTTTTTFVAEEVSCSKSQMFEKNPTFEMNVEGGPQPDARNGNVSYVFSILFTVILSVCFWSYLQQNTNKQHIADLRENLGALTKHVLNNGGFTDDFEKTELSTHDFQKQTIFELREAQTRIEVLQNRIDYLEKINNDKFGRPDYASADFGGKVVSVRVKQWKFIVQSFVEQSLKIGRRKLSNRHCCIIQENCPGHCQAFYGSSASIAIRLMDSVILDGVTIEHVPKNILPDMSSSSAVKEFSVWGLENVFMDSSSFFFGNFIFDAEKDFLQSFNFSILSTRPYNYVMINVASNHGADYTCIHR
ncbi:SUN domain-containing protein 2 [Toxorhynchites rutilus septentrionalis]|uniref:SUN domain-containing protein 2 n=1 Tax=Toxorhynchites rutilus septentrionalis TaxID=329112 RepID=UPI00247AEBE2|nr:SUN domain-containing protein 2 [Toxorhynchites rutilus septentrionalis]